MKINPTQPINPISPELPKKSNVEIRLFEFASDVEKHVGDVVHFNKKPCVIERIGELVTIVTMNERKLTFSVLPHQINCVIQRGGKK